MIKSQPIMIAAIFILLSCLFSIPGSCEQGDADAPIHSIPSLMDSIQFSGEIFLCGIKIPYEDPEIRHRLEKEMLLAVHNRPQVILWMKRSARYFPIIETILKEENLPLDLKFVPIVESGLRPHSGSSKGAMGYWQFLKSTGRRYGLRVDHAIDDRRNIFKSTRAACYYYKKLNTEFGSPLLALAAYNMGEFGLNTEITAQENRDFFSLYLPLETQQYVVKIIAAKMILEQPEKYGFFLKPADLYPEMRYSKVNLTLDTRIPIAWVSKAALVPFKTIKDMNPEIRGYDLDPGKMTLLIPEGKEKGFEERFLKIISENLKKYAPKFHIVQPGESLSRIAEKYNMPLSSLLLLNNFSFKKMIHPGDRLLVR